MNSKKISINMNTNWVSYGLYLQYSGLWKFIKNTDWSCISYHFNFHQGECELFMKRIHYRNPRCASLFVWTNVLEVITNTKACAALPLEKILRSRWASHKILCKRGDCGASYKAGIEIDKLGKWSVWKIEITGTKIPLPFGFWTKMRRGDERKF